MSVTIANLESELITRGKFGRILALAGLDGVTVNGSNYDLRAPLIRALPEVGYQAANPLTLVDSDVSSLTANAVERVLLAAKRDLIDQIILNWDEVEKSFGADKDALLRFEKRLKAMCDALDKELAVKYSVTGVQGFAFGCIESGSYLPRLPEFEDVLPPMTLVIRGHADGECE
jgi:hypothetical protein